MSNTEGKHECFIIWYLLYIDYDVSYVSIYIYIVYELMSILSICWENQQQTERRRSLSVLTR